MVKRISISKAQEERPSEVLVNINGRKSRLQYGYDSQGFLTSLQVTGGKVLLQNLIPMLNREWISQINLIKLIEEIETVDLITEISNITSVDLIDRITLIDTISAITNIANLQSLDLIDRITLIDEITKIDGITDVSNIASVDLIDRITLIDDITNIGTIANITAANVQTSGGANIVIDKLTQSAFTSRGDTLKNYTELTPPAAPSANVSNTTYKGKYFPRGARGHLYRFAVYCKRTGAGTLTLSYSPFPGMGAIGSVTVTPGADWAYVFSTVDAFWNYDSLFVWVSACSADVSYGYDTDAAGDAFTSADNGVTWSFENRRYIIAADFYGLPVGTVPVSGTINNIAIPNASAARQYVHLTVPSYTEVLDTIQNGSGRLLMAIFQISTDNDRNALVPRIYCDGALVLPMDTALPTWNSMLVNVNTHGVAIGVYDATNHFYSLVVTLPFPFKRSLQIGYYCNDVAQRDAYVCYTYEKIP